MAQETVDRVVEWLRRERAAQRSFRQCQTADIALLSPSEGLNPGGVVPPEFDRRMVEHCCAHEWAVHLDDVMVRRTSWHYYHRDAGSKAEQVSRWMSEILGWDETRRRAEVARYHAMTDCQVLQKTPSSMRPTSRNDQQPLAVA